ncbi:MULTISPECIES: helix-turn-helix domain-containing protein [Kordiimonas]|jgi:putative transcriptional regulator|uniref:helix-turn-helix domain-containing protein n=1 Tax=Kordiimonas TaxID=288021 RepID=UPI00257CA7C3|nr:helix-turn-helix transcriptional regulator [Kordiimonas sp. UBA4487]
MIRFLLKERIADKEFSEKRRISMDEISKSTGISRQTLSRMMNTHGYNATTDNLDKLCGYFNCELEGIAVRVPE